MKKIIFGLFVTAGASGFAMANCDISNKIDLLKAEKVVEIKSILNGKTTVDCWYGTTTNYFNSSGELTATITIGFAADCLPGDADGTVSIKVKRVFESITPP